MVEVVTCNRQENDQGQGEDHQDQTDVDPIQTGPFVKGPDRIRLVSIRCQDGANH
jgi:hypothetical protein